MNPLGFLDLSYAVWKTTKATASATVYYMTDSDKTRYKLFIVLTTGTPKVVRGAFRHDIDRASAPADAADFEATYLGTAVLITNPNDAIALTIA